MGCGTSRDGLPGGGRKVAQKSPGPLNDLSSPQPPNRALDPDGELVGLLDLSLNSSGEDNEFQGRRSVLSDQRSSSSASSGAALGANGGHSSGTGRSNRRRGDNARSRGPRLPRPVGDLDSRNVDELSLSASDSALIWSMSNTQLNKRTSSSALRGTTQSGDPGRCSEDLSRSFGTADTNRCDVSTPNRSPSTNLSKVISSPQLALSASLPTDDTPIPSLLDDQASEQQPADCIDPMLTPPLHHVFVSSAYALRYRIVRSITVKFLPGHAKRVKCCAVDPSEQYVVSVALDDTVVSVWSMHGKGEVASFEEADALVCLSLNHARTALAASRRDHGVAIWDAMLWRQRGVLEHPQIVVALCFSQDDESLFTSCQDKWIRRWSLRTRQVMLTLGGFGGLTLCVKHMPKSGLLACGTASGGLAMWRDSVASPPRLLVGHTGYVMGLDVDSSEKRLVSCDSATVILWSLETFTALRSFRASQHPALSPFATPFGARMGWSGVLFAPGSFDNYIVAATSVRYTLLINLNDDEEAVLLSTKAPVSSMATGGASNVVLGDTWGNLCLITLSGSASHVVSRW